MKDTRFCFFNIDEFFDRIEIVNKDSQISELCVIDSYPKVEAVMFYSLAESRNFRFEVICQKALDGINDLSKYQKSGALTTTQNFEEIRIQQ